MVIKTRGNLSGEGPTENDARYNLDNKIDAALESYYTPSIIRYGRYLAFLYRTLNGWAYKLLDLEGNTGIDDVGGCCMEKPDREEVEQDVAQYVINLTPISEKL